MSGDHRVAVLGAGSFGTALAHHIALNNIAVRLWGRNQSTLKEISDHGENRRYLPGISLSGSIEYCTDLHDALNDVTDVLIAVPSQHFNSMLEQVKDYAPQGCGVLWACKGLEPGSGRFLSDVAGECLGNNRRYAVLSGPTFAAEIARQLPTAIVVASNQPDYALSVSQLLHNDRFRAYSSDDIQGVQLGGALKNVYAIAAGISDGLEFGANARVAVITRGLAELMRLGDSLNVQTETLMGLSGVGDLILTCTDDQSRNRRYGLALAQGSSSPQALQKIGQSVEGVAATKIAVQLASQQAVSMPIVEQVHRVISGTATPREAVSVLLSRSSKKE